MGFYTNRLLLIGIFAFAVVPGVALAADAETGARLEVLRVTPSVASPKGFFTRSVPNLKEEIREKAVGSRARLSKSLAEEVQVTDVSDVAHGIIKADVGGEVLPPDQVPSSRIDPNAPSPFRAMAVANRTGDKTLAAQYAQQFVRYQMNLMFEVRELTQLIGQAMVEEGAIDDEELVGVEQYIDQKFTQARSEGKAPIKPTHEEAMKRVVSDPKQEVEVYAFISLNNTFSRKMAPDLERLWRVAQGDKRIRMVILTLGPTTKEWIDSYREYTGLTAPIHDGAEMAKVFRVAYVPSVVMVAPNNKAAYLKTGQQEFARLYDFLRTVQGLPANLTPQITKLMKEKIGQAESPEQLALANGLARTPERKPNRVHIKPKFKRDTVERF